MQTSIVITILNEEKNLKLLLAALLNQTQRPDEVIVVDAESTDHSRQILQTFKSDHPQFPLKILQKAGNRSQGRNYAISQAQYEWLALTDGGCIPHSDWLAQLVKKAADSQAQVVAGYYDALPRSAFEAAVVPYMLVMPDKVQPSRFLPATRSMLLKKSVWKQLRGFDETLTVSEDYDFAHRLLQANVKIAFTKQATVSWLPISSLKQFFQTASQMAEFDVKAGVTRLKAWLVFFRYGFFAWLLTVVSFTDWTLTGWLLVASGLVYSAWALWKNAQYLDRGWFYLPLLQLTADLAVMWGMSKGLRDSFSQNQFKN